MQISVLEKYINNFYGYGSWDHDFWFIGMEEGGGNSLEDLEKRILTWEKRGGHGLEDARPYHLELGITQWYGDKAKLQKTWEKIIRVYLAYKNSPTDKNSIRQYQTEHFGCRDSNNGFASLELFSLPSQSTTHWIYNSIEGLPYLINRQVYKYYLYPKRADTLRHNILSYKPKFIVIYGINYLPEWEGIIQKPFKTCDLKDALMSRLGNTQIFLVPHAVAHGYTNDYWTGIGKHLAKLDKFELAGAG